MTGQWMGHNFWCSCLNAEIWLTFVRVIQADILIQKLTKLNKPIKRWCTFGADISAFFKEKCFFVILRAISWNFIWQFINFSCLDCQSPLNNIVILISEEDNPLVPKDNSSKDNNSIDNSPKNFLLTQTFVVLYGSYTDLYTKICARISSKTWAKAEHA